MLKTFPAIFFLHLLRIWAINGQEERITRETNNGQVAGIIIRVGDEVAMETYLGIPYASPPVGDLRWRPPQPYPAWRETTNDPLVADSFAPMCPQMSQDGVIGDEDCLYLNVYVPYKDITDGETRPVIVWIHGGSFTYGSSDFYDAPLSWYADVVLVTINYRLGPLGFMSTGNSQCPGNYGLLDQRAALQWVNENIEYFGGDKDRVTIAGESSGAASAQLHALSPLNMDDSPRLFHRVISESGSAFSEFGFVTNPAYHAAKLIERVACPGFSMPLAMECLRSTKVKELLRHSVTSTWRPVTDGAFLTDTPFAMAINNQEKLKGRYEYLTGINAFDAVFPYKAIDTIEDEDSFHKFLYTLPGAYFKSPDKIADAVFVNYVDWTKTLPSDSDVWRRMAVNVSRDFSMLSPSTNFSDLSSSKDGYDSKTYFYLFAPRPSEAVANSKWAYAPDENYYWVTGARHAEELAYVFGIPLILNDSTPAEKELSQQMMTYWGNFARTGNPNSGSSDLIEWPEYDATEARYLMFAVNEDGTRNATVARDHLESDKVVFWTKEVPLYGAGDGHDDSVFELPEEPADLPDAIVQTDKGLVQGLHLIREDYMVDRFFGIPYAEPPVGDLRFRPPQPHQPWAGVLVCNDTSSAKQWQHICPQRNVLGRGNIGEENCLYLNVWVPGGVNATRDRPLPVMMWIYGGGFNIGTSTGLTFFYDMERIVAQGNVIGVSFNYRLNSLGFLSTGDESVPGNAGIYDNIAVMEWIQNNIANFGGDPAKVTIYGESAGSVAVSLHMVSPVSKDLFLRGISESGTTPSSWTYERNPLVQAQTVAEKLLCPTQDTKLLAGCLRNKPVKDLVVASIGIAWNVVVDGYFLPDNPENLLTESADKDYLLGFNSMEGHGLMSALFPQLNLPLPMSIDDVRLAAASLAPNEPPQVSEAVAFKYIEWDEPPVDMTWPKLAIVNMGTDWTFAAGTYLNADTRLHTNGTGKTYIYTFAEKSRIGIFPEWTESNHMREMVYTFGHPFEAARFNDSDRVLSLAMMTYWTNFAWSGNPNYPNEADILTEWPEYTLDTRYTMRLNTSTVDDPEQYKLSNFRGTYYHMWKGIMDSMWDLPLTTSQSAAAYNAPRTRITKTKDKKFQFQAREVNCADQPLVRETSAGCVEGYEQSWDGIPVERYLGIPFGQPPTGSLRFADPVPVASWEGTKSAQAFSKSCPQGPTYDPDTMDEDCLYLCVYVPASNVTEKRAVMVWFYGGRYQVGNGMAASQADGLAAQGDVIVVTPNYRVASFGFMGTDDDASPGNYGLLDQHLSLVWVKENIANFGGDPNRVTIFGVSAGAQSVLFHSLSPMTVDLGINRALMESAPLVPHGDMTQLEHTTKLAQAAACDVSNGNDVMVECLRGLTPGQLVSAQTSAGVQFMPTVDGYFLPAHPRTLGDPSVILQWKYLLGANDGDGSVRWSDIQQVHDASQYHEFVSATYEDAYTWRTNSIDEEYADYNDLKFFDDDQKIQKNLIGLVGDESFITPTLFNAENYSAIGSDVFLYYFTYANDSHGSFPQWGGASHAAEVPFVFGQKLTDDSESDAVKDLSRKMIAYWTNFAKTGDPNVGDETTSLMKWSQYDERVTSQNYMRFDTGELNEMLQDLKPTNNAFWNDYMVRQSVYYEEEPVPITTPTPPVMDLDNPQVETSSGFVRGKRVKNELFDVDTFIGIPYASPPLGELRFAKTVPVPKWDTSFDATVPAPPCLQTTTSGEVVGSENCLYLDVFVPSGIVNKNSQTMPVMVWIHGDADGQTPEKLGGSFWSGGGSPGWGDTRSAPVSSTDPSYLANFGNVVVVRPNFRLGVLGFLTTEDSVLVGNYALWDLLEVISWVVENAGNFGGDSEKITLFGQGSGAAMAEILASSPLTEGKIKRVISQSGSKFSPWVMCTPSGSCRNTAESAATSTGCDIHDGEELASCLRSAAAENIIKSVPFTPFDASSGEAFSAFGTWRVRQDGELIPASGIQKAFSDASFDYMTGTTNHEFYRYLQAVYPDSYPDNIKEPESMLTTAVGDTYRFLAGSVKENWPQETFATLVHSYTPWENTTDGALLSESATKYYADLLFATGSSSALQLIGTSSPRRVYQYVMTKQIRLSGENELPAWLGARHGDDLIYLFGLPFTSASSYTDDDRSFSKTIMSYWINFAWFGDPNNVMSDQNWVNYRPESTDYLKLGDADAPQIATKDYNLEKNDLWHDVVPHFATDFTTIPTTRPVTARTETPPSGQQTCPVPSIGNGLGLNLTPEEADSAIYAMFSVCLILGSILICIGAYRVINRRGSRKTAGAAPVNGKANNSYEATMGYSKQSVTSL